MSDAVSKFIERTRQLTKTTDAPTGVLGTTNKQSVMLELQREASLLQQATNKEEIDLQIDKVIGALHVAQAMNILAINDLHELMLLLEQVVEGDE